ncbi:MAG TPA: FtsQ-type POTRA domain-containing protein [Acidimicrobiales bacterium]|nr:FtsQ-type POTRA domain-containing protein [Acidimicrobiales bacterium]
MSGPRVLDRDAEQAAPPLAAGVDPRFRARRIAVRKDAGRKRLKRLLLLVGVAVLALAAVVVLRSPVLDVDEVVVVGTSRLDPATVRSEAGIGQGSPLLLADLGAAADRIESMPWVAEAEVTRDLPGRVDIAIREREPVAVVSGAGTAVLVDVDGRVLEVAPPVAGAFVQVVAAEAPPEPGDVVDPELLTAVGLAGRLRVNPAGAVAAVHLEPSLQLHLAEGGVVDLGDTSAIDAKVEAFRTVHARVDRSCLATIDLTVPTHPVLTRDQGCGGGG